MADDKKLIEALRSTRDGYHDEKTWHRYLLDAYAATGGFTGRVRMPFAGYWGSAAEVYNDVEIASAPGTRGTEAELSTYLDRYAREDLEKFKRRIAASQYANYVETILDLRLSYLSRKPMTYSDVPKEIEEWMQQDVGGGVTWDRLMREAVRIRAALLGWCPVLFDKRPTAEQMSAAQAAAAGADKVRAFPLFPANILDYEVDDFGRFVWAKVQTSWVERPDPLAVGVNVQRITFWFVDRAELYEIEQDRETKKERLRVAGDVVPHTWGSVPIVSFRPKASPDDAVRGVSVVASVAQPVRRLFNYLSELDEHLRATTFAILQAPMKGQMPKNGTIKLSGGSALAIPFDSNRDYKWVSPDSTVAVVYEKRIEATAELIHRMARASFTSGVASKASSGVAQAYEFEGMNRAIADMAYAFASSEQEALRLVERMRSAAAIDAVSRVSAANRFDVEELSKELDDSMRALTLGLGATANGEIRKRTVARVLPNLDEATMATIEAEIDELSIEEASASAHMRELAGTMNEGGGDGEADGEEGDGEAKRDAGEAPPKPKQAPPKPKRGA